MASDVNASAAAISEARKRLHLLAPLTLYC
jgi:hypothetical protein